MPKSDNPYPDWPGFDAPRYTPIPDDLFDLWLPHLSGAELKVLLYICRRTFGWKKDADAISLRQIAGGITRQDGTPLDYGTGLAEQSVLVALRGLAAKGLITATRRTARHGGAAPTIYAPRLREPPLKSRGPLPQNPGDPSPNPRETLPQELGTQETPARNTIQEGEPGPSLAAVLAPYGGAWAKEQARAAALCAAQGWTPAQLSDALTARREAGLRQKLAALAGDQ